MNALTRLSRAVASLVAGTGGVRRFLTTGEPGLQNGLVATFWGAPLRFEAV